MLADEDDPTPGSAASPGSHIPISFKIKIAKEVYNKLDAKQKKEVNTRRENDWKKLYKSIPEIKDTEEKREKLLLHHE